MPRPGVCCGTRHEDKREYEYSPRAERESGEAEREDMGRALSRGQQRTFSGVAEGDESRNELDEGQRQTERSETGAGVTEHDGAGKTFAERIRATATGLYAAAERMGERLRGIAENVFAYATGQRDAERASHAVESAGAALERADRTLEPVIQREQEIRDERLMQEREHELSLERSVSRKSVSGHWMALRWDGETMKNDVFSGLRRANVACSIWLHRYSCG